MAQTIAGAPPPYKHNSLKTISQAHNSIDKQNRDICREISRNVILSCVIEPIAEKPGCTSRMIDKNHRTKLEYFLIAGVNVGDDFYDLAERVLENERKQPDVIFDIAYNALHNSFRNRQGGKVNFGILGLLTPIITSQLVYNDGPIETIEKVPDILKNTSKADVEWNYKFINSAKNYRQKSENVANIEASNLYEYFRDAPKEKRSTQIFQEQFVQGLPILKRAYTTLEKNCQKTDLIESSLVAYNDIINDCENVVGIAADYACSAIYLYLTHNKNKIII